MRNFSIKTVLVKIGLITLMTPISMTISNPSQQEDRTSKNISLFELDDKKIFDTVLAAHSTISHHGGND